MAYAIGIALAFAIAVWATLVGLDRDRAFYPTVLVVVASYYVLFAVIGGAVFPLLVECAVMTGFVTAASIGFRRNLWFVAAALAGHGVFDAAHGFLIDNPGLPVWWPAFCLGYDITAAGVMIWVLKHRVAPTNDLWQRGT